MANIPDFSHQDWRDRSFRRRDLRQANFEGADLRGCDFRDAQLEGAIFINAKLGCTRRQILIVAGAITILLGLAIQAFSQMTFGALGVTHDDPAFPLAIILWLNLALAGATTALQHSIQYPQILRQGSYWVSLTATCIFIGFFYGAALTENNLIGAIASAMGLTVAGLVMSDRWRPRWLMAGFTFVGAIAAYGFCFTTGTMASSAITTQHYGLGIVWTGGCLLYLKWTLDGLRLACQRAQAAMGTCFNPFV